MVVRLANILRDVFDNISSTLFFEYQNINALVEHFFKTQKDSLVKLVGLENPEPREEHFIEEESFRLSTSYSKKSIGKPRRFLQSRGFKSETSESLPLKFQDIAIIGLSGRYPQAKNIKKYWENLKNGKNCITEIPRERWNWENYYDKEKGKNGSIYTKWGGFIDDIDKFDTLFFQISPQEAELMDPQERLFIESAYASIEDSGYTSATLCKSRKVGVFVGIMNGYYPTGPSYWSIANRISYFLNFQGPSVAVDTACSSSLTAIHMAIESLYSGLSECAIAGGVNLIVDPVHYMRLSTMRMLSSDNECRSFGENADGFVDGEGVGTIVLKPFTKAIQDRDHIYAIIKGSSA